MRGNGCAIVGFKESIIGGIFFLNCPYWARLNFASHPAAARKTIFFKAEPCRKSASGSAHGGDPVRPHGGLKSKQRLLGFSKLSLGAGALQCSCTYPKGCMRGEGTAAWILARVVQP